MVVIHVKGELEDQQFLYECSSNSTIDEISNSISQISNLQSKIQTLALSIRNHLFTDRFKENYGEVRLALDRALSEAETYASKDQALHKRALSAQILRDHIGNIEKKFKIAHSKILIDDDHLLQVFSDREDHEDVQLRWAGKELMRGKKLSEYIGENDKTKIIVRLKSVHSNQQHHPQRDRRLSHCRS